MRCTLCLLLVGLAASPARAEGLIWNLPPDGSWVRYRMEMTFRREGANPQKAQGTFTLASVGAEQREGKACRWIEGVFVGKVEEDENITVFKLLVPEICLGQGATPTDNVREAWFFVSRRPKVEKLAPNSPRGRSQLRELKYLFFHEPYLKPVKLPPRRFTVKSLGEIACQGVEAELLQDQGIKQRYRYTLWLHEKVPFGVMALEAHVTGGNGVVEATLKMTLEDWGRGAKSQLPPVEEKEQKPQK